MTSSLPTDGADETDGTGGGVIIDIGTGDGRFVYQSARRHPDRFYIGVDAQTSALEKISEKIHRKPAKGGLPNVLFIQASVEALPAELDGVADEVHIHFPWGSLLRAVAMGEEAVLGNLRRVCAPEGWLEIVIALDPERDQTEISRLGLEPLTAEFLQRTLIPRYQAAGFDVLEYGVLAPSEWQQLNTSWA
ncbi:MAG: class I SAM-dependent methyltransferase, partial [Acidobacteria bacterium]|nr:class I SAM-dependent methyltransferase [Acidobacteriota bacterium]